MNDALLKNQAFDNTNFDAYNMNRLDQHRSCERKEWMTANGILGATRDDYLTQIVNNTGKNPYVMQSINPDFVRVPKAEDDELPDSPGKSRLLTEGMDFNM